MLLSHASRSADGSPAVLIGDTDVTAMPMAEASNVFYTPRLPLPACDSDVTVCLVLTPAIIWECQAPRGACDSGLKFNRPAT